MVYTGSKIIQMTHGKVSFVRPQVADKTGDFPFLCSQGGEYG